jgi:peptidoglycan/xylan/chitin deacetylase (PgdA/CDA1 family)
VVVPDRGPFGGRVALTFDDGPSLANTPRVLEILAAHEATATFFITGRAVASDAHRDLLREMVAAGHMVGNHTTTHPNSATLSADAFRREVAQTHEVVAALGQESLFFRFPYGSSTCTTSDIVKDAGYHVTGWHIDTADWCFANASGGVGYCSPSTFRYVPDAYRSDFVGYTLHQLEATDGGVILMHDVHSYTVGQLDALLTALEQAGYEVVGLDDLATFPLLNGEEPPPAPWIGTPCTTDASCSFAYGEQSGTCQLFASGEAGLCALPCEGYCPDRAGFATTFCVEAPQGGAGLCVPRAEAANADCADLPGTAPVEATRWIGESGARPTTAVVCLEDAAE